MAIRTRLPTLQMSGHLPVTRPRAIRTGNWLALEALTSRVRRHAVAVGVAFLAVSMIPLAAMAARKVRTSPAARSAHPQPPPRAVPSPRLDLPIAVNGGQYTPLLWSDVAGWAADDHVL